jgi:DDE superfamily endonuclease/Winged helix-turn helix
VPAVPSRMVIEIPAAEQVRLRKHLRRTRWGGWLTLPILLLRAQQRSPTAMADWLLCSRSTVYAAAWAWQPGRRPWESRSGASATPLPAGLTPTRQRSLWALLKSAPSLYGWCRTRGSGAALAKTLPRRRGWQVSAETVRRWLHALGWVWKRAKLAAKDNDPERVAKLARIRRLWEGLRPGQALRFADELDIQLLPQSGYPWMPKGTQVEVMTPGKNEKRYWAGAWDVRTGQVQHCVWASKTNGLFRALLETVEAADPARRYDQIYVVVDNYQIHKARAVEQWLTAHRRVELVFLPTYCPKANPIERLFGDAHDKVTRNHTRKQIWRLVEDVKRHLARNGPWRYRLSEIYFTAEVTAMRQRLKTQAKAIA